MPNHNVILIVKMIEFTYVTVQNMTMPKKSVNSKRMAHGKKIEPHKINSTSLPK